LSNFSFILGVTYTSGATGDVLSVELLRTYYDLHRLHSKIRPFVTSPVTSSNKSEEFQFPTAKLKNMLKVTTPVGWVVDGANWQPQLNKSVRIVNTYFSEILSFCSEEHSRNELLVSFCSEKIYLEELGVFSSRQEDERRSRDLQQYFMCPSNVDLIVRLASPERCECKSDGCATSCLCNHRNQILIEPSCGDGRVLVALSASYPHSSVVGNDIDPVMVEKSKRAMADSGAGSSTVLQGDFLLTRREDYVSGNMFTKEEENQTITGNSKSDTNTKSCDKEECSVVVVGGPPYTAGAETGAQHMCTSRSSLADVTEELQHDVEASVDVDNLDLPFQFLMHACTVLRAHRVVFLLPERCGRRTGFISHALRRLAAYEGLLEPESQRGVWEVKTYNAEDGVNSEFDLCGRAIRQPVVLQVWQRVRR